MGGLETIQERVLGGNARDSDASAASAAAAAAANQYFCDTIAPSLRVDQNDAQDFSLMRVWYVST